MLGSRAACGRRRQRTPALPLLMTAAALLETANECLLPAMYREVGAALGASPVALGSITLCRALVQALCYPLATWAAARSDRARVVAAGTFLSAAATALAGASTTVLQMAVSRGFNGVGLALVLPAVFSLVADYSDDDTRGSALGWLFMAQGVGAAMGTSLGVLLAPTTPFFGVPGWRLAFHALALVSVAIAVATWLLAAHSRPGTRNTKAVPTVAELAREAKAVVSVPTFRIIVAQGVAAQVPLSALTFMAMWLELVGFTHGETTVITSLNSLSLGLGSLLAGFAGDLAARQFPYTGRIALAQVSNASTVPLAALLLLPARAGWPMAGAVYAGGFLLLGIAIAWSTASTSKWDQTMTTPFFLAPCIPICKLTRLSGLAWQPYLGRDRAGEGEDGRVRSRHVLRERCRVVRAARRGHPGGARLRVPAAGGRRPGERGRSGEGGLRGDRRAGDHLLPHVLGDVLDLPRGQRAGADDPAGGVRW
jgi:MFS family permease